MLVTKLIRKYPRKNKKFQGHEWYITQNKMPCFLRHPLTPEHQRQHQPGDESPDVSHVGNAAGIR